MTTIIHYYNIIRYKKLKIIKTDGVTCSIVLSQGQGKYQYKKKEKSQEKYLTDLTQQEKNKLKKKKLVAIDPNMSDLIYAQDETGKRFRYTQNQRRKETKVKKHKYLLEDNKWLNFVEGKTIKEWES